MFLKRNALKALMTRAYKGGGLSVRNDGVGLSIGGAKWCVYFIHGDIPKETLGDLISLVGELPAKGESYVADKNGNQMEIFDDTMDSPMDLNGEKELTVLPLVACGNLGVLRDPDTGRIVPVPVGCLHAIDFGGLAEDEETPEGPFGIAGLVEGRFYNAALWQNSRMAYSFGEFRSDDPGTKDLLASLESMPI